MLYFVRHLKTEGNLNNIVSGQANFSVLPNQMVIFPEDVIGKEMIIISSPADRCIKTVESLTEKVIAKTIEYDDNLLERNLGILEGMKKEEAIEKYPNCFFNGRISVNAEIPKSESINDVKERVSPILKKALQILKTSDVVICSHNQTLKVMYALINKIEITNEYWNEMDFENGKLYEIY